MTHDGANGFGLDSPWSPCSVFRHALSRGLHTKADRRVQNDKACPALTSDLRPGGAGVGHPWMVRRHTMTHMATVAEEVPGEQFLATRMTAGYL